MSQSKKPKVKPQYFKMVRVTFDASVYNLCSVYGFDHDEVAEMLKDLRVKLDETEELNLA